MSIILIATLVTIATIVTLAVLAKRTPQPSVVPMLRRKAGENR